MPNEGYVCRKCWLQISTFHEFYNYIESIHATDQTIFQGSEFDAGDEDVCSAYGFEAKMESPTIGNIADDGGGEDSADNGGDDSADDDVDDFQVDEQPKAEMISMADQVEENPRPKRKRKLPKTTNESTRKKSVKKGPATSRVFQ